MLIYKKREREREKERERSWGKMEEYKATEQKAIKYAAYLKKGEGGRGKGFLKRKSRKWISEESLF